MSPFSWSSRDDWLFVVIIAGTYHALFFLLLASCLSYGQHGCAPRRWYRSQFLGMRAPV